MKRIKKIVFVILSILLGLVLAFNVYNFISIKVLHKDLAAINGYALLEVVSGSMEPTIYKGDMIIINTKEKDYKENDIITFRGKEGEFVTHRIKYIDGKTMITKGDNNNTEDDAITVSSIVGKYVTKINGAGRILSSFKNPFTLVMIFIIGLLACVLLSTDSDGKPLLEKDELEFQEFLKNKNAKEESKEELKTKEATKKKEKNVKEAEKKTTEIKKVKTNTKVDTKKNKVANNSKVKNSKPATKKEQDTIKAKPEKKKVTVKANTAKKSEPKKAAARKVSAKKTTSKKVEANKSTKKSTTSKNSKK